MLNLQDMVVSPGTFQDSRSPHISRVVIQKAYHCGFPLLKLISHLIILPALSTFPDHRRQHSSSRAVVWCSGDLCRFFHETEKPSTAAQTADKHTAGKSKALLPVDEIHWRNHEVATTVGIFSRRVVVVCMQA